MLRSQNSRLFLFSLVVLLISRQELLSDESSDIVPLYAGTQLAFYSTNSAPGDLSVQPYIFGVRKNGVYDKNWSLDRQKKTDELTLTLAFETGITEYLDVSLVLNGSYTHYANAHSWLFGDTVVYFGWQVLRDQKGKWVPDFRLLLGESFPTGKSGHLNPRKGGSDIDGSGSYETIFLAVINKVFYFFPKHPIDANLNVFYVLSTRTRVRGINTFGGTPTTKGTIKPGQEFIVNLGLEYSINRYWALGLDIHYVHQNKSLFSGNPGKLKDGSFASMNIPSSEQISLAPCIEYCWSEDLSVAAGPWFTIAGRNSQEFCGMLANVYYYF